MKKVIVIGASGTIGSAVVSLLQHNVEVVRIGINSGDFQMDMGKPESIQQALSEIGGVDAIISVGAGPVAFKSVTDMTINDYRQSLQVKLLGQIDLVLQAIPYLSDGGSLTLTTGILNRDYIPLGSAAAMVNNAVEGFVQSAALELPRGLRLNAVSPTMLTESQAKYADFFPGFESVPAARVAQAYLKSIEGIRNGHIFTVDP